MKLTEVDNAILTLTSKRSHFSYEIEHQLIFMVKKRVSTSSLVNRCMKLIHVGLITRTTEPLVFPGGDVSKFSITEQGYKILKACNRQDAKSAKKTF